MSVPPGQSEHSGTSRHRLSRLLEQFLEFRPGRGALPNNAVPAGLIGLCQVRTRRRAFEFDRLDPGGGLTTDLALVLLAKFRNRLAFAALGGLAQNLLLRLIEPVPRILVDEYRYFGGVEAGVDAVFRFLVPTEVEYSADRPA